MNRGTIDQKTMVWSATVIAVHYEQAFNRLSKQPDESPNRISGAPDSRISSCAE